MLDWLKAATIRAVKTFCQTAVALIGTELVAINTVDWANVIAVSLTALVLSYLTSVAGLPEVNESEDEESEEEIAEDIDFDEYQPDLENWDDLDAILWEEDE